MARFAAKRIYDDPEKSDGYRVLVDRLWPRGVSKEDAALDDWAKDVAPSSELRKAYHGEELTYEEFAKRYDAELDETVEAFRESLPSGHVTLLTATKDVEHSAIPTLLARLKKR